DRAGGDLSPGDVDALVGLGVRPQRDPARPGVVGHARDVAIERLAVEDQHRGVELVARCGAPDERAVQSLIVGHVVSRSNSRIRWSLASLPCGSTRRRTAQNAGARGYRASTSRAVSEWRLAQCGRPPRARNSGSTSRNSSCQRRRAYWWIEIDAHGPRLNGL